jgi:hypothetical protein
MAEVNTIFLSPQFIFCSDPKVQHNTIWFEGLHATDAKEKEKELRGCQRVVMCYKESPTVVLGCGATELYIARWFQQKSIESEGTL